MNRYSPRRPTAVLMLAAAATSAIVLTLAVGVPTHLAGVERAHVLAAARPPIEVAIEPASIEVVGIRGSRTASVDAEGERRASGS